MSRCRICPPTPSSGQSAISGLLRSFVGEQKKFGHHHPSTKLSHQRRRKKFLGNKKKVTKILLPKFQQDSDVRFKTNLNAILMTDSFFVASVLFLGGEASIVFFHLLEYFSRSWDYFFFDRDQRK